MRNIALPLLFSFAMLLCCQGASYKSDPPPGVIIGKSPSPRNTFIGSPSILILPDGTYLASHDFFGKNARMRYLHTTRIFSSKDKGITWKQIAHIKDLFWANLFYHNGAAYLMGTTHEYGKIVVLKSTDNGQTWTNPKDSKTGLITSRGDGDFHTAPVPMLIHNGRIWRAFEEYTGNGPWSGRFFKALVISAPVDADLLDADSWTRSNGIHFKEEWMGGDRNGWLEGNIVPTPDGKLVNILRLNDLPDSPSEKDYPHTGYTKGIPRFEAAAVIEIQDEKTITFNPEKGFIHFPGSQSKFTIRYDSESKLYWAIVNKITAPYPDYDPKVNIPTAQRNVLVLTSSPDLKHWTERCTLLRWRGGESLNNKDPVGFQYVDWRFEGADIIAVVRTAWNADNYHNSNYITFHRFKNFRSLTAKDSAPDLDPL